MKSAKLKMPLANQTEMSCLLQMKSLLSAMQNCVNPVLVFTETQLVWKKNLKKKPTLFVFRWSTSSKFFKMEIGRKFNCRETDTVHIYGLPYLQVIWTYILSSHLAFYVTWSQ